METVKEQEKHGQGGSDFPSFIPPLMVKELRRGLRTRGFVLFLILFPLLMSVPFFLRSVLGGQLVVKTAIDVVFWLGVVCVLCLFNPVRALGMVRQEKETGTNELIVLTRMTSYGIVSQKWMSLIAQTLLLSMMILPFYLLRYFLGGMEIVFESGILLALFVASCVFSAIALWVSGMAVIYRILFCMALIPLAILAVVAVMSQDIFRFAVMSWKAVITGGIPWDSTGGWAVAVLWIVWYWLFCRAFLYMAARWFAPPSENTGLGLRKSLLWMLVLFCVYVLLSWAWSASAGVLQVNIMQSRSFLIQTIGALCLVDMVWPRQFLPVHVKKLNERGGWSRRLRLLLLPGWQGAGLLLLCVGVAAAILNALSSIASGLPEYVEPNIRVMLLICVNSLFLGVVFQPLYRRTGQYSLLVYTGITIAMSVALSIWVGVAAALPDAAWSLSLLSFTPMGSHMVQEMMVLHSMQGQMDVHWNESLIRFGNWTLIVATFLIFFVSAIPFWRRIRRLDKDSASPRT